MRPPSITTPAVPKAPAVPRAPAEPEASEGPKRDHGALVAALVAAVGREHVLTTADLTAGYTQDWTRRFSGIADAVVRPADADQVANVVRICGRHGVPIVPQGGNTGLVGGGVPRNGGVVVSMRRLDRVGDVDHRTAQVTAGAGVTLAALHRHVSDAGFAFGVDFGARDSATIGGMIATNAGGLQVLRYGSMRAQVVGVEAVFADGSTVSRLQGLVKDNTGYDLAALIAGSEGTLAIVTAARLRLVAPQPERVVAAIGLRSLEDARTVTGLLRDRLDCLNAVEVVFADGIRLVSERLSLSPPPAMLAPVCLLVECAARADPAPLLAEALADVQTVVVGEPAVASDTVRRRELWRFREGLPEAINTLGPPVKMDVSLPSSTMVAFVDAVPATVQSVAPGAAAIVFGHLGDGNLHVNVVDASRPFDGSLNAADTAERIEEAVLRLVQHHGGSISAEHGIGTAKARWLNLSRSTAEIAVFRAIKTALDPAGILNPGVLFPMT